MLYVDGLSNFLEIKEVIKMVPGSQSWRFLKEFVFELWKIPVKGHKMAFLRVFVDCEKLDPDSCPAAL